MSKFCRTHIFALSVKKCATPKKHKDLRLKKLRVFRHSRYTCVQKWTLPALNLDENNDEITFHTAQNGEQRRTVFVRINGKRIYLGKFGSAEAAQNYARYIAEWAISSDTRETTSPKGTITVNSPAIAFLDHTKRTTPNHYHGRRTAVRILLHLYSGITVDAFTPKCLAAVQHQFTQHAEQIDNDGKRRSRQYCNALTHYIKGMFRWGVAQELVPPSTADALKYVLPIRSRSRNR